MNKSILSVLTLSLLAKSIYTEETDDDHHDEEVDFDRSQSWVYGMLASLCISILGFVLSILIAAVLKYRKMTKASVQFFMNILISFAIGALLGDAFVHIVPEAFTVEGGDTKIASLLILLGFLVFSLLEKIMEKLGHGHQHGIIDEHGHGHADLAHDHAHCQAENRTEEDKIEGAEVKVEKLEGNITPVEVVVLSDERALKGSSSESVEKTASGSNETAALDKSPEKIPEKIPEKVPEKTPEKTVQPAENKKRSFCSKVCNFKHTKTEGILILLSGLIHNTMDGLAIGVAFASGKKSLAVSTFVAIFAHEVPKELGDMGILIFSKFEMTQAVFCNGFINLTALIGAAIGLAAGQVSEVVNAYIFCFVAGNFIYIATVSMMPVVNKAMTLKGNLMTTFGFALGAGVMFAVLAAESGEGDHDH